MKAADLRPASQLSMNYGIKAILYGEPGSGKTPLLNTAPRPLLLACEPGLKSMSTSGIPTWEAYSEDRIKEFFDWYFGSKEAAQFDTLCIDSGSQMAEIYLKFWDAKCKDGRKAYGEMSDSCMNWFDQLFFQPSKHIILICKLQKAEVGKQVTNQGGQFVVEMSYQAQPFFPGKDLNIKVPHRYDEILYLGKAQIPGFPQPQRAIRCAGTAEIMARDRTGKLGELEPPDLGALFKKAMS